MRNTDDRTTRALLTVFAFCIDGSIGNGVFCFRFNFFVTRVRFWHGGDDHLPRASLDALDRPRHQTCTAHPDTAPGWTKPSRGVPKPNIAQHRPVLERPDDQPDRQPHDVDGPRR
jgi:hypothetical protein